MHGAQQENQVGGFLTLMLETEAGSGQYQKSTSSTWPGDDYIFNENMSACENGGELTWDSSTNSVKLLANSSDACYVYFDKRLTLAEYVINQYSSTDGNIGLYYHDTDLVNGSVDNSYRFAGGDYQVTITAISAGYTTVATDSSSVTNGVVNFYCNGHKGYIGQSCRDVYTRYYTTAYNETVEYSTYEEALEAAVNDGYLTKDNIKNFVCFGSDAETCPSDNLYRIIGVFENEVKLIKSTSYGSYAWDSGNSNTWDKNTKPDIRNTLNTTFLETLSDTWQDKIATHSWEVGGMPWDDTATAREYYDTEIRNQTADPDSMKIGLMYVSDYGFAVSPSYWSITLYNYDDAKSSNWMYSGSYEWTISHNTSNSYTIFFVNDNGSVGTSSYTPINTFVVRPVFYLNSNITYVSGSGTSSDPIRIN